MNPLSGRGSNEEKWTLQRELHGTQRANYSPTRADADDDTASGAGTKRKQKTPRVDRACDACRKRKSRCTGANPQDPTSSCTQCLTLGRPCHFEPPKRLAPRTYAESLENRLEAMEGILASLSAQVGLDGLNDLLDEAEGEEKLEAMKRATALLVRRKREADEKRGNEEATTKTYKTSEEFDKEKIAQDEMSIEKSRYVGPGSNPHFARSLIGALVGAKLPTQFQVAPLVDSLIREDHERESPPQKDTPLPPPDLAASLINAYFANVNSLLPLLHRPSFERALKASMETTDPSFRCLCLMVFALGARFHPPDPRLNDHIPVEAPIEAHASGRGWVFFRGANFTLTSSLLPSSLFDIQTSCLGILWLMGASSPVMAWNNVGWSVRRAVDVGAHTENRARWAGSVLEDQLRKRAFHYLMAIDRYLSATTGRPLALQDDETDLNYPLDISDAALDEWNVQGAQTPPPPPSTTPSSLSGMIAMLKLQHLVGKTLSVLYGIYRSRDLETKCRQVAALDSELNAWLGEVPVHLRWEPDMPAEWLSSAAMLQSGFYSCQILVHREFMTMKETSPLPLPSLAICKNAARSTTAVFEVLRRRGDLNQAFWYAPMQIGVIGLVVMHHDLLKTATLANPAQRSQMSHEISRAIELATALTPHTMMAFRITQHLHRLRTLALAIAASRPTPGAAPLPYASNNQTTCSQAGPSYGSGGPMEFVQPGYDPGPQYSQGVVGGQMPFVTSPSAMDSSSTAFPTSGPTATQPLYPLPALDFDISGMLNVEPSTFFEGLSANGGWSQGGAAGGGLGDATATSMDASMTSGIDGWDSLQTDQWMEAFGAPGTFDLDQWSQNFAGSSNY